MATMIQVLRSLLTITIFLCDWLGHVACFSLHGGHNQAVEKPGKYEVRLVNSLDALGQCRSAGSVKGKNALEYYKDA